METRRKTGKILLIFLCALCVLSLSAMLALLLRGEKQPEGAAYTPPPFDPAAVTGFPEPPEHLGFSPMSVEQGYTAYLCGNLFVKDRKADVWFTSPETNTVWILLRITDEHGNTLGETGVIRPGEYVKSLALAKIPDSKAVTLKMIAYGPESYVSMGTVSLNTTLKISE